MRFFRKKEREESEVLDHEAALDQSAAAEPAPTDVEQTPETAEAPKPRRKRWRFGDIPIPPINAVVGYLEGASAKDAEAYAKGYIDRRFDAKDQSYYAILPFMDGYLYEVHEGGSAVSHLPGIVSALNENPDVPAWFPSGRRVFQIEIREGRPLGMLLPEGDSRAMRESHIPPAKPTGRMKPAISRGHGVFAAGLTVFGVGLVFFSGAAAFHTATVSSVVAARPINIDLMPHRQWNRVSGATATQIADAMKLDGGRWSIVWRAIPLPEAAVPVAPVIEDPQAAAPAPLPVNPTPDLPPKENAP